MNAKGLGNCKLSYEVWTPTKDLAFGASFAYTWEIGTSSMDVWEYETIICLAGDGDLGVGKLFADVWMIGPETSGV